jgi:hypothetical protein
MFIAFLLIHGLILAVALDIAYRFGHSAGFVDGKDKAFRDVVYPEVASVHLYEDEYGNRFEIKSVPTLDEDYIHLVKEETNETAQETNR